MMKLTLDLGETTTWADLKKWVAAVESVGVVEDQATIVDADPDRPEYQSLQVEL